MGESRNGASSSSKGTKPGFRSSGFQSHRVNGESAANEDNNNKRTTTVGWTSQLRLKEQNGSNNINKRNERACEQLQWKHFNKRRHVCKLNGQTTYLHQ